MEFYKVDDSRLIGKFLAKAMVNTKTGEVLADAGAEITPELLESVRAAKINEISTLYIDYINVGPYIRNTLEVDKNHCREEALLDVYGNNEGTQALKDLFHYIIERNK